MERAAVMQPNEGRPVASVPKPPRQERDPAERRKAVRVALALEVSFGTAWDAVCACSRDLSTGGMALQTSARLPPGSLLQLTVRIPGLDRPLEVAGEVAWSSTEAMGVAFRDVSPEAARTLRTLIASHLGVKERVLGLFGKAPPTRAAPARLQRRDGGVRLRLRDELFADVLGELLRDAGQRVLDDSLEAGRPELVITVPERLGDTVKRHPGVPLVLLNVSGADALVGAYARVSVARFVPRGATPAEVAEAVRDALAVKAGRAA